MISSYKNREVDLSKPVEMYRCLNRKGFTFSIRQGGKVVGHTSDITLFNCELVVNKSGKDRCIKSMQRNVHAFVRGTVGDKKDIPLDLSYTLNYVPCSNIGFHINLFDNVDEIDNCKTVYLQEGRIYCQI